MLQYVYFILLLLSYLYCKLQLSACDMDYKAWRGKLWAKGERRKPYERKQSILCASFWTMALVFLRYRVYRLSCRICMILQAVEFILRVQGK
jgi:hypothetical protein